MLNRFNKLNIILKIMIMICISIVITVMVLWVKDNKFIEKKEYLDGGNADDKEDKKNIMDDPAFWRGTRVSQGTIPAELVGITLDPLYN